MTESIRKKNIKNITQKPIRNRRKRIDLNNALDEVLKDSKNITNSLVSLPPTIQTKSLGLPEGFKMTFSPEYFSPQLKNDISKFPTVKDILLTIQESRQLTNIISFINQQSQISSMTSGHLSIRPTISNDVKFQPTPGLVYGTNPQTIQKDSKLMRFTGIVTGISATAGKIIKLEKLKFKLRL